MKITRRALLRTSSASALIVIGPGVGWLMTRTSTSAREPWRAVSQGFGDPRLDALAFAILAPNPHNMQPWQITLQGDDSFSVYARPDRLLPETDPPGRQSTIGFGCFLELLRQAAAERGYAAVVTPFPEGEPQPTLDARPVASVTLVRDQALTPDPLFAFTLARRTQRAPFDTGREVSAELLSRIQAAARADVAVAYSAEPRQRERLRKLTTDAWITEWENASTRRETVQVTRIGKREVSDSPWGITLDGALMSTLGGLGLVSRRDMDTPGAVSYEEGLKNYIRSCETAMAHLWMSTDGNNRRNQLNAGASWVRMQQAATREGLAFQPLSQALQEFPAMADHYARVHEWLAPPGHTLQMLSRLGFVGGDADAPAPREPLTSKLTAV